MALDKGYLLYGRYRIDVVLGRGGMGSVYRALDENLGIPVAVKENLFTTEEYARQFRREATILAGLRHSNLPRVTDHFVIAGQGQYLVMDFIDGDDLRTRIEKGNLPSERLAVDWARQICDALHYLHNRQPPVVHRDIKPGNIRITPDGRAVLVDFGLARLMEGPTTTTGAKAMTPGYSPPEQYGASRTDSRTDIYALAATMYTLLTGAMPEDGLERALGQRTLTPIRTRNPKVSPGVSAAIEKALEVLPENRFQTISDFQKALHSALPVTPQASTINAAPPPTKAMPPRPIVVTGPLKMPPPPPPKKVTVPVQAPKPRAASRWGWGCTLGVVLLGILVAGGFLLAYRGDDLLAFFRGVAELTPALSASAQTQTAAAIPTFTVELQFTEEPTHLGTDTPEPTASQTAVPTFVGQAQSIAFVSDRSGIPQIYTVDVDGRNEKQLTIEPEGACQPDWSPDGTQLIFTSPCKSLDGGFEKTSIFRINADGSGRTSLTKVPGGDYDPAWSPDGTRILVTSLQDRRAHLYVMDANGDNRILLSPSGAVDSQARWSPAGDRIVFISKVEKQIVFIGSVNPDKPMRQEFSTVQNTDTMSPDWSVDDYILYVANYPSQVLIFKLDARFNLVELSPKFSKPSVARFSPDGQWVLFDMMLSDNTDIYLMPIVGAQEPKRVTSHRANESDPAWRPLHGNS